MHVCFVCNDYPPVAHGGIGSACQDLAEGLLQQGHEVTVTGIYKRSWLPDSWKFGERENVNGVAVYRLPDGSRGCPEKLRPFRERIALRRWLGRQHGQTKFSLIEMLDYEGWMPFGGPKGVPVVARLQGSNLFFDTELNRPGDKLEHWFEKRSLKRASFWIGVSKYSFEKTEEYCHLGKRKGEVVHNCADTSMFAPSPEIPREPGLIVFVNSIIPKKGVEQLMDAANIVLAECPHARLVMLGAERKSGRYKEQLIERLKPELRGRVSFLGAQDRRTGIVPWLQRANVCCFPSHMEAFPIAPLEAMSAGNATVFSRIGPGAELMEDGKSGLLCDPYNPADIAEKLLRILRDDSLASELGRNARSRVIEHFARKDWVKKNLDVYERCVSETK